MSRVAGLRGLREELGSPALAALALLAAALAFLVLVLQPVEARRQDLERRLEQLRLRAPDSQAGLKVAAPAPASQLAAFYAFLERGPDTPESLGRLQAHAADAGLRVPAAEYRLHDTGTPLERYEIALSASGSYGELRAFLEAALADIPALSLDAVSFTRQRADEARVRADLRLTLHLVRR